MDDETNQKIKEKLEAEYYLKHKRLEKIAKRSFILSKQRLEPESEVTDMLVNLQKKAKLQKKIENSSVFSSFYFKYFMYKNPEIAAFLLLQLNANILVHPIDTIKVRIQAKSVMGDISGFVINKADKKSVYSGVSYSYYLVALQAIAYTAVSKLTLVDFARYDARKREYFNLLITDVISAPLKYYLDTKKMLLQMGNDKLNTSFVFRNYKKTFLPLYLRDITFKSLFFGVSATRKDDIASTKNPLLSYVAATLFTSIFTAPLDVICSKLATQKDLYYTGLRDAVSKINLEEGTGKFLSGVSMRVVVLTLLGGINLYFYGHTLDFVKEVYTLDNVID